MFTNMEIVSHIDKCCFNPENPYLVCFLYEESYTFLLYLNRNRKKAEACY